MNLNLFGKVAFVSGSSRGIGLDIAKKLHSEGCKVAINSRNKIALEEVSKKSLYGSYAISGDLTNPEIARSVIDKVKKHFGKIDILVCNVGSGKSVSPGNENYDEWIKMINLNLLSATNIVEASKKALSESEGCIVCISSICGNEVIKGAPITYSVAKAALNAYVKCSSVPLGELGIRINGISPGNIKFKNSTWDLKLKENEKQVKEMLKREVNLNKLGSPEDISNLVAYLVSPMAKFITGTIFTIDGGQVRS